MLFIWTCMVSRTKGECLAMCVSLFLLRPCAWLISAALLKFVPCALSRRECKDPTREDAVNAVMRFSFCPPSYAVAVTRGHCISSWWGGDTADSIAVKWQVPSGSGRDKRKLVWDGEMVRWDVQLQHLIHLQPQVAWPSLWRRLKWSPLNVVAALDSRTLRFWHFG